MTLEEYEKKSRRVLRGDDVVDSFYDINKLREEIYTMKQVCDRMANTGRTYEYDVFRISHFNKMFELITKIEKELAE